MGKDPEGTIPRRHPNAVFRVVEGQGVVVLPGVGEVQVLNAVGARIWELMDGTRSAAEIAGVVAQEFEVPETTATSDTLEFIETLRAQKML
jgi:pyrroloquinoline quinone biosynthesis protein D